MRNLKKFLALVLAMMMVMSLMLTVNAAKTPAEFSDSSKVNSTYAEAVNVLSALGVVKGDDRGFRPQETITRAEVAAMLYRIAHNDADESQVAIYKDYGKFPDVPSDKWYAGAVNYCANSEYIKGYSDGTFGAWRDITGYEVLAMTLRVLGYGQNGEFEGSGWMVQTARYARVAGLTNRIKEGTLGAPATREMVAEVMFQALQATLVDYNMLLNYYPAIVLIADNEDNRAAYKLAIDDGLKLPVNSNLMYENYGIVGKTAGEDDPYGRPTTAWVKDRTDDTITESSTDAGNAGKYIVNKKLTEGDVLVTNDGSAVKGQWGDKDAADATLSETNIGLGPNVEEISIAATPLVTYTDGVTECQVSKDINNDKTIAWANIEEYLNGKKLTGNVVVPAGQYENDNEDAAEARPTNFDARHTTTDFIGATGRTTEIYQLTDTTWRFVYIDTLLGEVKTTTGEMKDANGHVIRDATATVEIGANGSNALVTLSLLNPNGKFKAGDLVLVQTPQGAATATNKVDVPSSVALCPLDVPDTDTEFTWVDDDTDPDYIKNPKLLATGAEKVRVTVTATEGAANAKLGIRADNGNTYWASDVFLSSRNTSANSDRANDTTTSSNATTLPKWYDIDQPKFGITNSMIGSTYDIVLDQNGYIVGMDKVRDTAASNVGIITAIDSERIGMGKYVPVVTAFMTDGKEAEFKLFGMDRGSDPDNNPIAAVEAAIGNFQDNGKLSADEKKLLGAYSNNVGAESAWAEDNLYEHLGVGSLVKFEAITVDGVSGHFICDFDATAVGAGTGFSKLFGDGTNGPEGSVDNDNEVHTGVTNTMAAAAGVTAPLVNSNSTIFLAEGEYRYNVGGANEGGNVDIEYTVYKGFKTLPTIDGDTTNVLYQQLTNDKSYMFVYPKDPGKDFTVRDKAPITVDKSYLVLSRGATFEEYSEYDVLENGEKTTLKVANINNTTGGAGLNEKIEQAMADKLLITVLNTNRKGYVTSVDTVDNLVANNNDVAIANVAKADNGTSMSTLLPKWSFANNKFGDDDTPTNYFKVSEGADVLTVAKFAHADDAAVANPGDTVYMTMADSYKIQLINLDLKTVRTIEKAEALDYINGVSAKTWANLAPHDFAYELDSNGYVCNIYVIENTPTWDGTT